MLGRTRRVHFVGIGGIGINPLVNTQFQYIHVGVNITMTPWANGNDVTLNTSIEISAVSSYQAIGGIQQPIIGQRKISHVIRLRAGDSNILGGMFENVKSQDVTGIPGLSDIPGLKWLFSRTKTNITREKELIVLTPHIGFVSQPVFEAFARGVTECLHAWLRGAPVVRPLKTD